MIRVAILLRFPTSQLFVAAKAASFPNCAIFDVPCPRIVQGRIKMAGGKRRVSGQKNVTYFQSRTTTLNTYLSNSTSLYMAEPTRNLFRGTQRQFSENICSEDDLKSRIFGTFVVKFLACLPPLGFSNI